MDHFLLLCTGSPNNSRNVPNASLTFMGEFTVPFLTTESIGELDEISE